MRGEGLFLRWCRSLLERTALRAQLNRLHKLPLLQVCILRVLLSDLQRSQVLLPLPPQRIKHTKICTKTTTTRTRPSATTRPHPPPSTPRRRSRGQAARRPCRRNTASVTCLGALHSRLAQRPQNPSHRSMAFWTCRDARRACMIGRARGSSSRVKELFRRLGLPLLLLLLALRRREEALWISELRETLRLQRNRQPTRSRSRLRSIPSRRRPSPNLYRRSRPQSHHSRNSPGRSRGCRCRPCVIRSRVGRSARRRGRSLRRIWIEFRCRRQRNSLRLLKLQGRRWLSSLRL